ncbi:MAG TPA: DUF1684 domain-containing protein [Flavitalea sp.]|nr:DUF1684 domain-containing protein [Flavitalea sp.]
MSIRIFLFTLLLSLASQAQETYRQSIAEWDSQRLEELKSPTGWLNVAGLFWLTPGMSSMGKDSSNTIIIHNSDIPGNLGQFQWRGDSLVWFTAPGKIVTSAGKRVHRSLALVLNQPSPYSFSYDHYSWNLIQRLDKVAVRFRDFRHPAINKLVSIPRYPVDSSWRVKAKLIAMPGKQLSITNVLGQTFQQELAGRLEFEIAGRKYALDAIDEGKDELFILFGDDTNALETYASGRYIYIPKPKDFDEVILDFNKAENPPCAFTPYATCPLPPVQNRLSIAIKAGEKEVHGLDTR